MLIDDPEEVQLEFHDIVRRRKEFRQVAPFLWAAVLLLHAAALSGLVAAACWLFSGSNSTTVALITCAAYIGASIILAVERVGQRIDRMEMHALTVQAEVLAVKEKMEAMKWNS